MKPLTLINVVLEAWHSRIKRNPSNEEVYEFLDDLNLVNHNESTEALLRMQFGIPEDLAGEFVLAWRVDREDQ